MEDDPPDPDRCPGTEAHHRVRPPSSDLEGMALPECAERFLQFADLVNEGVHALVALNRAGGVFVEMVTGSGSGAGQPQLRRLRPL